MTRIIIILVIDHDPNLHQNNRNTNRMNNTCYKNSNHDLIRIQIIVLVFVTILNGSRKC